MSESEHLAEALNSFFEDPHNGWFTPLTAAIHGLSAEQAASVPARRFNSVWAVVNHVWLCEKMILLRLCHQPADRAALGFEDDWPPVGDPMDEGAWQAACQRMLDTHHELVATAAGLSAETLSQPLAEGWPQVWQAIQGVQAHNNYHTCEIISIRHMQALWVEEV